MAESRSNERERFYPHNPLLNPRRKYGPASEKSSLSGSFEAPKSYGATQKPLQPPCDYKLVGYELEEGDTLQGISIKFAVTVEELKRVNKLWTNDNIHIYKTLKIPVKVDSQFYRGSPDVSSQTGKDSVADVQNLNHSDERVNTPEESTDKAVGKKASALGNFLSSLDARIQNSKQESEKLRTITGPRVLAHLEKRTEPSMPQDEFLFRPLPSQAGNSTGQFLTSGRAVKKSKTAQREAEEQFFEL